MKIEDNITPDSSIQSSSSPLDEAASAFVENHPVLAALAGIGVKLAVAEYSKLEQKKAEEEHLKNITSGNQINLSEEEELERLLEEQMARNALAQEVLEKSHRSALEHQTMMGIIKNIR